MADFLVQNNILLNILLRLFVAMILGFLIGIERFSVGKDAGMKTHALVSIGAAVFIIMSEMLALKYLNAGGFDPSRIVSQIVVGVGFLGAGSIILHESRLVGLTTASGLWVTAAIGAAAGFGMFSLAISATILTLVIFVFVNFVERPLAEFLRNKLFKQDQE